MLYEKAKEDVINILLKDLLEVSFKDQLKEQIINELEGRLPKITSSKMFTIPQTIEMLNEERLYFILKAFNVIYKNDNHDVNKYFTKNEISLFDSQPFISEELNKNIIEIHGVKQLKDDLYFCDLINIDELIKVTESGYLTYDPRVQRSLKVIKQGNDYIKRIWLNKGSVLDIAAKIVEDDYFINAITWNIMKYPDGRENEYFEYDEENKILRIELSQNFLLQIIDGWHRTMGMVLAKQKDPNLSDRFMQLRITHYTMEKANDFINQEAKINKFTVNKQSSLENTEENVIVRQIDSYGTKDKNLLYNKIGVEAKELKIDKLITFNSLAYLIKNNFNLNNMNLITRGMMVEYLIDFFNIILTLNQEKFDFKNENLSTNQNLLCAMTSIAGELYNKKDWKNKLINFLNNFNWEDKQFKNYALGLSYGKFKELSDILLKQYSKLEGEVE